MPRFTVLSPVRTGGKTTKPSTGPQPAFVELSAEDGRDLQSVGAVEPAPVAKAPVKKSSTKRKAKSKAPSKAPEGGKGNPGDGTLKAAEDK